MKEATMVYRRKGQSTGSHKTLYVGPKFSLQNENVDQKLILLFIQVLSWDLEERKRLRYCPFLSPGPGGCWIVTVSCSHSHGFSRAQSRQPLTQHFTRSHSSMQHCKTKAQHDKFLHFHRTKMIPFLIPSQFVSIAHLRGLSRGWWPYRSSCTG